MSESGLTDRWAVGGEFEVASETPGSFSGRFGQRLCSGGAWIASGRGAFALILRRLRAQGVNHVHLPSYLCRSLLLPVRALGLDYSFYPVDRSLVVHPAPPTGSALLLIHYFGWPDPALGRLRQEAGETWHLVEDFSQALLSGAGEYSSQNGYAFFSVRKFGPVPLGGWSSEPSDALLPSAGIEHVLAASIEGRRLKRHYLLEREREADPALEERYLASFAAVEEFLEHDFDCALPAGVLAAAAAIDWDAVGRRRRENWLHLRQALGNRILPLQRELPDDVVPLGFVVELESRDAVRAYLARNRVFCPVQWPLPEEVPVERFPDALYLSRHLLTIPIDQRYGPEDMERVAWLVKECC